MGLDSFRDEDTPAPNYQYSKQEIVEQIQKAIDKSDTFNTSSIDEYCDFTSRMISQNYGDGSFYDALENLGFDTEDMHNGHRYTHGFLHSEVQRFIELYSFISVREFSANSDFPSRGPYDDRFNSMSEFLSNNYSKHYNVDITKQLHDKLKSAIYHKLKEQDGDYVISLETSVNSIDLDYRADVLLIEQDGSVVVLEVKASFDDYSSRSLDQLYKVNEHGFKSIIVVPDYICHVYPDIESQIHSLSSTELCVVQNMSYNVINHDSADIVEIESGKVELSKLGVSISL